MHSKKPDGPYPSRTKNSIISWLKSIFSGSKRQNDALHSAIKNLQSSAKQMSADERHILGNFLQFCSKTVEDVMIPRSDICAVRIDATMQDLSKIIMHHGHTRTLVYQDTLDSIVGFVHIKDLFDVIANKRTFNLKKLMRKPIIAATSMKLIDILAEMQRCRTHIAVVVDEYGGTDGIATIEDIMEAIVGEIEDEHDLPEEEAYTYKVVSEGEIITHARVAIAELEQSLGLKLKNKGDDCDTIGGLILSRIGHMPVRGTIVRLSDGITAEIMEASPRVLKRIKLSYSPAGAWVL